MSIIDRFWKHVINNGPDQCWGWIGSVYGNSYPKIGRCGRGSGLEFSHRLSWMIHYGEIPKGMMVCHKCDNRKCTNPNHLFLGTAKDNKDDCINKGRNVQGEDSPNAKLTLEQVKEIRAKYIPRKVTYCDLSKEYGVSSANIAFIIQRKRWKWL